LAGDDVNGIDLVENAEHLDPEIGGDEEVQNHAGGGHDGEGGEVPTRIGQELAVKSRFSASHEWNQYSLSTVLSRVRTSSRLKPMCLAKSSSS
jgi:hypothetical protein